jgi:UDP-galactopyranose mutase
MPELYLYHWKERRFMTHDYAIVAFSHLRWDFVYQRPQHLLSRLAAKRRVFFIEEPIYDSGAQAYWERSRPEPNVMVCRPHTPLRSSGFCTDQFPALRDLLPEVIENEGLRDHVVWLYTPMALPVAQSLRPQAVVYDCMDELSMFLNAPPELLEHESALLRWADLVFTGGPSLYRAKKGRHPNLHCFPSSVDAAHFRQACKSARDPSQTGHPEPGDQAVLPHPRLGFHGVIDERLDLPLLDALAQAHPAWQVVMVGPVVKIDTGKLPRHPNLHYLGQRSYNQLPAYLAGWDVCLLPFARNDATRFISPTKTLEYMAAELPVVSTPITDVAEPYGDIVYLGDSPQAFISACEQALEASDLERSVRAAKMRRVLANTSWDATARAMEELIFQVLENRQTYAAGRFKASKGAQEESRAATAYEPLSLEK